MSLRKALLESPQKRGVGRGSFGRQRLFVKHPGSKCVPDASALSARRPPLSNFPQSLEISPCRRLCRSQRLECGAVVGGVQICSSLSLQTLVQNVPRCDVMCCDVQCCAVLCCVMFRRAVCNQIVILRFVETHRRPPVDVQTQLDELPKASWDLLCSLCFLGGKARRHNGTKA